MVIQLIQMIILRAQRILDMLDFVVNTYDMDIDKEMYLVSNVSRQFHISYFMSPEKHGCESKKESGFFSNRRVRNVLE